MTIKDLAEAMADAVSEQISRAAENEFPFRHHLGASLLGGDCELQLFFSFRWVRLPAHSTRVARIFERGRREELLILDRIEKAGFTLMRETEGKQLRAKLPPHLGGSMDAVLCVPADYVPKYGYYMPIEVKTHADKYFKATMRKALSDSNPKHWCQGNTYAVATQCTHFMYVAENKNTDELSYTIHEANAQVAQLNIMRGERIIYTTKRDMLKKTTAKYQCNMCDYQTVCTQRLPAPSRNCRSCENALPLNNGTWSCMKFGHTIEKFTEIEVGANCPAWVSII